MKLIVVKSFMRDGVSDVNVVCSMGSGNGKICML